MARVVVSGAGGRLGKRILAAIAADSTLELAGALVREGSSADGRPLSELTGDPAVTGRASADAAGLIGPQTVLIETAPRSTAIAHAELAAARGAPLLVATTGFEPAERRQIELLAVKIPVLIAPNLSPGIAVLTELVRQASRALAEYDLEVLELHHGKKRDAPSGTAWALAREAAAARGQDVERDAILARAGDVGARGQQEIGMQSLRGGDVIGEHTVYLFGATERLELTHRAQSRDVFAAGAARAARFLGAPDRAPGLYAMKDVFGL